jgi:multidrug efflux pump subunit AcrA (membrane-fusion protein)
VKRSVVVLGVLAALVALAASTWWRAGRTQPVSASAAVVAVSVRTFTSTVVAIGAVKPKIGAEVRVGSRISGRVAHLRANIGDMVARGQIVAELETEELDALIGQRRAEVRLAEAMLGSFDTIGPEEVARAEADVRSFEAAATLARQEWEREQQLFDREISARATADAARDRYRLAEAQLEATRRGLALARTGNDERRIQARADVDRARAQLESALVDRSFTVIRTPISGVVASVSTQEGETVAAGLNAPTFLTVVDLERLQVHAFVDEVDIGKIEPGQSATFSVDAFPGRDFAGHVSAIFPTATVQDNVVKYVVAVDVDDESVGVLRPEMTTNVRIQLASRDVLAVPTRAIRQDAGQSVVHVLTEGRSERRAIRVGWRDGPWAEIVEGLSAGERILLDGPAASQGVP